MFTIIYDKSNGLVMNITSESNPENLKEALPENMGFIFVEDIPKYNHYRQQIRVVGEQVIVENLVLTPERELFVRQMEINDEIQYYRDYIEQTNTSTMLYIDGIISAEEYEPIKDKRKSAYENINKLESQLKTLSQ